MATPDQAPPPVPQPVEDAPSRAVAVALPKQLQVYARTAVRWRVGCEVVPLRDGGETYTAMLVAITSARRSICFETYILASDATGERFKAALVERARAGVAVRLMYDAVGSFGLSDAWLADLRAAGGEVVVFNPITQWRRRWRLSHRDHRKILVIDDDVAFTGGLNIANDYAAVEDGGIGWHDEHCRVRGPIVLDLARLFRRTWLRAGGSRYPAPRRPAADTTVAGSSVVRMIENTSRRNKPAIRRAYLHVIKAARRAVWIENAYFMPDRGVRRALARAVRRGVDVRVIVPGHSDVRLIEWASLYAMRKLAKRGVRILRWRGVMLHAKTAVVDETWSTIGSYNFDAQSRFNNLEATLEILDSNIGQQLARQFERDGTVCDPFDEHTWRDLPWYRKLLAWVGYRLRRFL